MKFKILILIFLISAPLWVAGKVNINTAGSEELKTLNGIGLVKATAIIEYRTIHGPFSKIEDITNVSGIPLGGKTFDDIKDYITVDANDTKVELSPASSGGISDGGTGSTYSSPSDLSVMEESSNLSVNIGRERLLATGSRILFRATAKGLSKSETANVDYYWNFGDGSASRGQGVYHTYTYPGLYNVLMDLTQGEQEAVARTTVRVTDPEIKLSDVVLINQPAVELKNLAGTEVNLGEWRLVSGKQIMVLPTDTIIAKGGAIAIPFVATASVNLVAPSGQVFATVLGRAEREAQLAMLQTKLTELVAASAAIEPRPPARTIVAGAEASPPPPGAIKTPTVTPQVLGQTIEVPKPPGFWSRLAALLFR
ncbi:MAG: helix-hairpin-helix domain-containing protein [Candidatus Vogelbacteria bacterium]|nr:helix-hairpin-helix domain-containing protein [Candidatus Vogelbacteria bacterium]